MSHRKTAGLLVTLGGLFGFAQAQEKPRPEDQPQHANAIISIGKDYPKKLKKASSLMDSKVTLMGPENAETLGLFQRLAGLFGKPKYVLVKAGEDYINATIISGAGVLMTRGATSRLTLDEQAALIGHELGHEIGNQIVPDNAKEKERKRAEHENEFAADRAGAAAASCNVDPMISALRKMVQVNGYTMDGDQVSPKGTVDRKHPYYHPSMESRIARLEASRDDIKNNCETIIRGR